MNSGKLFHSIANLKIPSHILASCTTNFNCQFSVRLCFRNCRPKEILQGGTKECGSWIFMTPGLRGFFYHKKRLCEGFQANGLPVKRYSYGKFEILAVFAYFMILQRILHSKICPSHYIYLFTLLTP